MSTRPGVLSTRVNTALADTDWAVGSTRPVVSPPQGQVVLATPTAFLGGVAVASATVAAFDSGMG